MKYVFLLLLSLTVCFAANAQIPIGIDSMFVYADTLQRGYTTASAYTHFDELNNKNTNRKTVTTEDQKALAKILGRAQKRRHFQTKEGMYNLFCVIAFSNTKGQHRVLIGGVAERWGMFSRKAKASAYISDLTHMETYIVSDKKDLDWITSFRKRNYR
ncbi:MAG: hypothetical protein H6550_04920 [Chitinophagales bacterium]|nr:hypothetical protein [Chitinophagales bacterium]